jgi:hypothetical protein
MDNSQLAMVSSTDKRPSDLVRCDSARVSLCLCWKDLFAGCCPSYLDHRQSRSAKSASWACKLSITWTALSVHQLLQEKATESHGLWTYNGSLCWSPSSSMDRIPIAARPSRPCWLLGWTFNSKRHLEFPPYCRQGKKTPPCHRPIMFDYQRETPCNEKHDKGCIPNASVSGKQRLDILRNKSRMWTPVGLCWFVKPIYNK